VKKLLVTLTALGLVVGPPLAARGEPTAGGEFCRITPGLCGGITGTDDDEVPEATEQATAPRKLSRFFWRRIQLNGVAECRLADGRQIAMVLIDRLTNEAVTTKVTCPDPTLRNLLSLPTVPPAPSTVWDQVPLPMPEVRVNPRPAGLTGLDTFFWYDQPATESLQLALDGFTVTVDARVVRLRWRTGDGGELISTVPGSAVHPAVQHIYESKGNYTVGLDVTWSGTYRFAGPGVDPGTAPLGERTFSGQTTYAVAEIRGVRQ
jgi:hypothetical protein